MRSNYVSSFEDLAMHCYGKKMMWFVQANMFLFCFGTCIAYIVAIGDTVHPVMAKHFHGILSERWFVMTVFVVVFIFPISIAEKINQLRFTSMLVRTHA